MNFCLLFVSFCVFSDLHWVKIQFCFSVFAFYVFSRFIWICTLTVQKMKFFFGVMNLHQILSSCVLKKMGTNAFCGLKCLEFSSRVYFWVFSYSMNSVQLLSMATEAYQTHYWACPNRVKSDIFICSWYFVVKNAKICKWYLMLC